MNPFSVRVEMLEGPAPKGAVLKSAAVGLRQETKKWVEQASTQAIKLLKQAQQKAKSIQDTAAQVGALQKAQAIEDIRIQTRDATLKEALQWLVDEQALEARIVESIESRMREMMATVLQEWLDDQDELDQLARRLTSLAAARVRQHPYKLRLHPKTCETLQARYEGQAPFEHAQWLPDPALDARQAVFEDTFLRVEFDLALHWNKVINTLRAMQIDAAEEESDA